MLCRRRQARSRYRGGMGACLQRCLAPATSQAEQMYTGAWPQSNRSDPWHEHPEEDRWYQESDTIRDTGDGQEMAHYYE
eukprot:93708-Prymnesium_polylepis.1